MNGSACLSKIVKLKYLNLLKIKFENFRLTRYNTFDNLARKFLAFFGEGNIFFIFNLRICKYIPFVRTFCACLLIRSKVINKTPNMKIYECLKKNKNRYFHYAIADWLLMHRKYSDSTEYHFIVAQERNKEININIRYSDYVAQKYGYKSDKMKRIIARLTTPASFRNLTKNQKLRLSLIVYHTKNTKFADKIIKTLGNFILCNTISPYLSNKIAQNKIFTSPYIIRGSEEYRMILNCRSKFRTLIKSAVDDFCIIGNAPTEINTGNGLIIDNKKVVIRINNYSLDYPEDYGTKQDIWIRVANSEVSNKNLKANSMVIFAANNFAVKRKDADRYLLPPYLMGKYYTAIPSYVYRTLINELDGLPSTGLAITYWIYTIVGLIPKEAFFGFTHFYESSNFNNHYYDDNIDIGIHIHEWNKERDIFEKITK